MNPTDLEKLKEICTAAGFKKKENAFFRIVGDGVFQIIKCQNARRLHADVIYVGLYSMYGKMDLRCFSGTDRTSMYSVINCYEKNTYPLIYVPEIHVQLQMLQEEVIPWLNGMVTQKQLSRAINSVDSLWHSSEKIWVYLACGEYNHAKKVIKEIIGDYCYTMIRKAPKREETVEDLLARVNREEKPYYGIIEIIDRGEEAIQAYLKANLEMNMQNAKLCTK